MAALRSYVISIICAALLCGILSDLAEKTFFQKQLKLVCSIFLAAVLLKPLVRWTIPELAGLDQIRQEASEASAKGEGIRIHSVAAIIKQEAETYILKEAASIGAEISVTVELDYRDPPTPIAAVIRGSFDGTAENRLSSILADDLGIPKEQQTWIRTVPHESSSSQASMPMSP